MKIFRLICILTIVGLISCKKEKATPEEPTPVTTEMTDGLPGNTKAIHGYLYAGYYSSDNSGNVRGYLSLYAAFRDPASDLLSSYNHYYELENSNNISINGNVRVGSVEFNNKNLTEINNANSVFYWMGSRQISYFDFNAAWLTKGNESFKPVDLVVSRGFPKIIYPTTSFSLSQLQDYTIDLKNFIFNFDTLIVTIGNSNNLNSNPIEKKFTPNSGQSITFKKEELAGLNIVPSITDISFQAFNYSNKIINDKIYLFELANKFSYMIYVNN